MRCSSSSFLHPILVNGLKASPCLVPANRGACVCVVASLCNGIDRPVPRGGSAAVQQQRAQLATGTRPHCMACTTPSSISGPPRSACIWPVQRRARLTLSLCELNRAPHPASSRCVLSVAHCLHLQRAVRCSSFLHSILSSASASSLHSGPSIIQELAVV
jgi:hypothetical protein